MAYTRTRARRPALAGLQSQPPGSAVWNRALAGLGTIAEYGTMIGSPPPPATPSKRTTRSLAPRWYTAIGTDEDQARTASAMENINAVLKDAADTAEKQKWLQLAATLSIPLAAYVWKWLLKRRGAAADGTT